MPSEGSGDLLMRRMTLTTIVIALLAEGATAASADPTVTWKTEYYRISGKTASELIDQMQRLGPTDRQDGRRVWVNTAWSYRVHWGYRQTSAGCAAGDVSAAVGIAYLYPLWVDEASGDADARDAWKKFIAAAKVHEPRHAENGIAAAEQAEAAVKAIAPQPTCDLFDKAAGTDIDTVTRRANEADGEYDRATEHGATQGMVLLP
jgi:predicted secreted Zn-dependent protease